MFIDELQVHIKSGKGGNGIVSWIHEKAKEFGGPGGGNGGKGGDVYVRGVRDTNLLASYRHIKSFEAENGAHGRRNVMHGKGGDDLYISLPIGSIIKNLETHETFELLKDGEEIMILRGGNGGLGNAHFKSSTNVRPQESTPGKPGEEANFFIELDLIADVGIIGLPNAGKSTFLNFLTGSKAKTADYLFTTLDPNLGNFYGYIFADIPGLIEGASGGKGLGHKFLKHIKRTGMLFHLIASDNESVTDTYTIVREELKGFDPGLLLKAELIILSKVDLISKEQLEKKKKELEKFTGKEVVTLSMIDDGLIEEGSKRISQILGETLPKA